MGRFNGRRNSIKEAKKAEAKARNAAWAKLSPIEQLASLNKRLGNGVGAVKQRNRIKKLLK